MAHEQNIVSLSDKYLCNILLLLYILYTSLYILYSYNIFIQIISAVHMYKHVCNIAYLCKYEMIWFIVTSSNIFHVIFPPFHLPLYLFMFLFLNLCNCIIWNILFPFLALFHSKVPFYFPDFIVTESYRSHLNIGI